MNEWHIQSRSHTCQICENSFVDKQHYFTLLFDEKHELKRLDVCEPCWKNQVSAPEGERKNLVSRWQGTYEAPPPAPPEAIQKDTAETLLRKLIDLNDPKFAPVSFILAVMLERKRLLKVKEQFKREGGTRVFVYEQPKTGDLFTICDPNLQLNQLEQVQRDVAHLLEHGLSAPEAPVAPAEILNEAPADHEAPIPIGENSADPAEAVRS